MCTWLKPSYPPLGGLTRYGPSHLLSDFKNLRSLSSVSFLLPELKSRVEASEALSKELNTRLDTAETKVEALEKINKGDNSLFIYFLTFNVRVPAYICHHYTKV